MRPMHRIVVDAMGGDHAPDEIVRGAAEASLARRTPRSSWSATPRWATCSRGCATTARASASTTPRTSSRWTRSRPRRSPPSRKLDPRRRRSRRARRRRRARLGRQHRRGVLACARGTLKLIPGVRRAALAAVYPTELRRGEKDDPFSLILDVGATIDATAEDLVGFAVMGSAYAEADLAEPPPARRAAVERHRGRQGPARSRRGARRCSSRPPSSTSSATSRASTSRAASPTSSSASGFVGNVVLKMLEGVSETVVRLARYAHKERLAWRLGLVDAVVGDRSLKERHRLAAVRRRAAARLRQALHQGARPLERARHRQRGQGRAQGGGQGAHHRIEQKMAEFETRRRHEQRQG